MVGGIQEWSHPPDGMVALSIESLSEPTLIATGPMSTGHVFVIEHSEWNR